MIQLRKAYVLQGNCSDHGYFRLLTATVCESAQCPKCRKGVVECALMLVGSIQTSRTDLPQVEAVDQLVSGTFVSPLREYWAKEKEKKAKAAGV